MSRAKRVEISLRQGSKYIRNAPNSILKAISLTLCGKIVKIGDKIPINRFLDAIIENLEVIDTNSEKVPQNEEVIIDSNVDESSIRDCHAQEARITIDTCVCLYLAANIIMNAESFLESAFPEAITLRTLELENICNAVFGNITNRQSESWVLHLKSQPRNGKTFILQRIVSSLQENGIYLNCETDLSLQRSAEIASKISNIVNSRDEETRGKLTICFDNITALCKPSISGGNTTRTLLRYVCEVLSNHSDKLILIFSSDLEGSNGSAGESNESSNDGSHSSTRKGSQALLELLGSSIIVNHLTTLTFLLPNALQRENILRSIFQRINIIMPDHEMAMNTLQMATKLSHGFSFNDFIQIKTQLELLKIQEIDSVRLLNKESDMIGNIQTIVSNVRFDKLKLEKKNDVDSEPQTTDKQFVGYEDIEKRLLDILGAVDSPNDSLFGHESHCKGIVIAGPSGSGKSALVHDVTARLKERYCHLSISCAEIVHKIVGESEKKIAKLFQKARELSPCILTFENIETILGNFDKSNRLQRSRHESLDRILSTFLCEIDGVHSNSNISGQIAVIVTTNDIKFLDWALIRPGRLDEHIILSNPNDEQRKKIIQFYVEKVLGSMESDSKLELDNLHNTLNNAVEILVQKTENMTSSNIRQIIQEIGMSSLRVVATNEIMRGSSDNMSIDVKKDLKTAFVANIVKYCA